MPSLLKVTTTHTATTTVAVWYDRDATVEIEVLLLPFLLLLEASLGCVKLVLPIVLAADNAFRERASSQTTVIRAYVSMDTIIQFKRQTDATTTVIG